MAIYHLSAQVIGRKNGGNAKAAAAYRAGEKIEKFDYTRKTGVDYKEILTPENAPEWCSDRVKLWSAVEDAEKRKDAQVCREINLALPLELKPAEREMLLKEFANHFTSLGMVADITIHGQVTNNPHGHIMLTTRELTSEGFGQKVRDWNRRELLGEWRSHWEELTNKTLAIAGHEVRIDHRSLKAQGVKRLPTLHLGSSASAMERRGIKTRLGERNSAAYVLSKEVANKQWHEKWIKRQEEIHQSKEIEKTQVSVVRYEETHKELEERLYAKVERKKNTSETYLEDLYLYTTEFTNKKNTEEKSQSVKTDIELIKEYNELGEICYTKEESELISNYAFKYYNNEPSDKELLIANERLKIAKESLQKIEENKKEIGFFSKLWNQTDLENEKSKLSCEIHNAEYEYSRQKVFFEEATKKFNNMKVVLKIKEDRKREASERQAAAMKRPEMKAALVRKEQEEKELQCQQKQQGQYQGR